MRRVALLPVLAILTSSAFAQDDIQQRCSALPTAAERIVCYDQQFPPDHAPAVVGTLPPASVADIPARSTEPASGSPDAPATSVSSTSPEADKSWMRGMFDKPAQVRESSTIKEIHRRDTQNMAFLLDNQQIWLQDSPRILPFKVGDAVTIENGTFGGYFLTSDGGTKTRVRRIK